MVAAFFLELEDATFHVLEAGEGIPVVFLHAGVCDSRMWENQLEAVAEAGYQAIAYDRRGFGGTESANVPFSHLDDLQAVLDALGIHAAIFVGCSRGGGVAIDFALAFPERTAGLVLVGTSVSGAPKPDLSEAVLPIIHAMEAVGDSGDIDAINAVDAHAWLDGPLNPSGRVGGAVRALFLEMNRTILRKPRLTREEQPEPAYDFVGSVDSPVLLVVGEHDFPHIVERHDELSDLFENAFAAVLEGAAHLPPLERPTLFNPLMLQFLDALTGADHHHES